MAFDVQPITTDTVAGLLAWCGVDSPTPQQSEVAALCVKAAHDTIQHYRGLAPTDALEPEYASLCLEMAIYVWDKRGIDGALTASENGVSRGYEAGSFPPSMLARIALPVDAG